MYNRDDNSGSLLFSMITFYIGVAKTHSTLRLKAYVWNFFKNKKLGTIMVPKNTHTLYWNKNVRFSTWLFGIRNQNLRNLKILCKNIQHFSFYQHNLKFLQISSTIIWIFQKNSVMWSFCILFFSEFYSDSKYGFQSSCPTNGSISRPKINVPE